MRRTKLYQLMAVVGGLAVGASMPVLADGNGNGNSGGNSNNGGGGNSSDSSSVTVVPLNWTAGTATVDGDISEWDLSDASSMNKMCTGGKIDGDRNCGVKSSVQLSTMYARYNCDTETMYVLVLEAGNYEAAQSDNDSWVTSDGESNKILKADGTVAGTQFAWVTVNGDFQGYEASFQLPANGTYSDVEVHLQVSGNTSSTGKFDGYTSSFEGLASCEMPKLTCNDLMGSNGASMKSIAEYEADGNGGYSFVEGSGTDVITIDGDGNPSANGGTIDIATFIEDGVKDSDGVVSGDNIQFCQVPVFDSAGAEVCLWSADKDADGNYVNIEQVGCVDAEKGKSYAIKAGGEFSSVLEGE